MKRFIHGSSFLYSPFLSLALFIMLLLVSLNYWSTSEQNKDLHQRSQKQQQANDHIQEKLIETNHLLKQSEKKQDELNKSEVELEKCFKEKMEIKLVKASNMSSSRVDDLVEKVSNYQEQNKKLQKEIVKMKEEIELKDARSVELGRRLKQFRDQFNANKQEEIQDVLKTTGQEEPPANMTLSVDKMTIALNSSQILEQISISNKTQDNKSTSASELIITENQNK